MNVRIKKGDLVEIITGRKEDKGKRGEVIKVFPHEGKVVVQGAHFKIKHQKQVQSQGRNINPGILKLEAPLDISNVMLVCRKCNKKTRVSMSREKGKPVRICKNCKAKIG